MRSDLKDIVQLIRPDEWIKNTFVLGPLLFSRQFMEWDAVSRAGLATLLFCLASSAVYVLNDLRDRESDRSHAVKRSRPIAADRVSTRGALGTIAGFSLPLVVLLPLWPPVLLTIWAYVGLQSVYSFGLKRVPLLDITMIAAGFVLRVRAGAVAIDVPLSWWMALVTFFLALYIAALKRRAEGSREGAPARAVLGSYSPRLLDTLALATAVCTIASYTIYAFLKHPLLALTVPLVGGGLIRYWRVARLSSKGEVPSRTLWTDQRLLTLVGMWSAGCLAVLWWKG